ncbi:thioredoxin domain-containing protein [Micromonospora sp. NPDC000119]|uniref:DsbA family protein n=2 Tax=Micromonospora TaxID=1873 RepID=UPI003331CEAD
MYSRCVSATRSSSSSSSASMQVLKRQLRTARRLNVVLAVAAVFLLVVAIAGAGNSRTGAERPVPNGAAGTPSDGADATDPIALRDPKDPLAVGDVDAPVVLVEFADLRCPYCALFAQQTLPTLLKDYVDTGKVRYEFRDVAFFGDQSVDAAVALRAAAEQGRFMQYLTAVYGAAPENKHPDLSRKKLIAFARSAGVPDMAAFESDLDRKDLRDAVNAATSEAHQLGITSVPFFVAGDQALSGAQPLAAFRQLLDAQLAKAGPR